MTPKAVILDIDGTLIDSNGAHADAWVDALAEHGYAVDCDRVRRLIGMGGDKVLPELTGLEQDSHEGQQISQRRSNIFRERYLPKVQPLPGTRDLLQRIRAEGLELGVATSAKGDEVEALLRTARVNDLVKARTTSSDVSRSKPDPDIVQAALDLMEQSPSATVMLGDTPYDVQAAGRAGVAIVAFRSGGWSDGDLQGAVAIYDDPADLLAHYDESPLKNGARP